MDKTNIDSTNLIREINNLGQSIWLDSLSRKMIKSGELEDLIAKGVSGITSNPTIFQKAISSSDLYSSDIKNLVDQGENNPEHIYTALATKDIQDAADLLMPIYINSGRKDGFVSIEVNPVFAFKSQESIEEGLELSSRISRPNIMIKIPGTEEGMIAITSLISRGINVNVTLLFSRNMYRKAAKSYIDGLKIRQNDGYKDLNKISSVASFFISRIDTQVDKNLPKQSRYKGKTGISNAKLAYQDFKKIFSSSDFIQLSKLGANLQRPLWASTSVKDISYPDVMYLENLIGKNTINTLPLETFLAFLDHGKATNTLEMDVQESSIMIHSLDRHNINFDQITSDLLENGVVLFEDSYKSLINELEDKVFANKKK